MNMHDQLTSDDEIGLNSFSIVSYFYRLKYEYYSVGMYISN